jgi:hypothetical protein
MFMVTCCCCCCCCNCCCCANMCGGMCGWTIVLIRKHNNASETDDLQSPVQVECLATAHYGIVISAHLPDSWRFKPAVGPPTRDETSRTLSNWIYQSRESTVSLVYLLRSRLLHLVLQLHRCDLLLVNGQTDDDDDDNVM